LAVGLGKFAVAVKTSMADGWDLSQDLPALMTAALTDLLPAINGVDQIGDEAKEDPIGIGLALAEGLRPLFKKAVVIP